MAAAVEAASHGLSVALLDEQVECGGQIYRSITSTTTLRPENLPVLGPDYARGQVLVHALHLANIDYLPGATVWNVDPFSGSVCYSAAGNSYSLSARRILIATGAAERPTPIHGWTLPGVMAAGGAQVLLKSAGMIPEGPVVLAGCGPLLLLTAAQLHSVGAEVVGVVETTTWRNYLAGATGILQAMVAPEYLLKGIKIRRMLQRANIPMFSAANRLEAVGKDMLEAVRFHVGKTSHTISASSLFLHTGVIPNTAVSRQVGIEHEWCSLQQHWQPRVSSTGCTSNPNIYIAGDGASILGAIAAEKSGYIAALNISRELGAIGNHAYKRQVRTHRLSRWRHSAIRPLLDTLFAPDRQEINTSVNDVTVCRCYEVGQKSVVEAVRAGCDTPDQVKALLRCGMGPCQGRMCASNIASIIAKEREQSVRDVGVFRARPPIKPITLGELAALEQKQASTDGP